MPTLYKGQNYINRWLWEVLPDGVWEGRPCFVIGGGPSLKNFDWKKLKGKRSIGVNLAFKVMDPTIIFSMDTRFLKWIEKGIYGEEVRLKFKESKAYKVWLATYVINVALDIFLVEVHKNYQDGLKAFTFSMRDGLGHGNNSGYAALNLAACLRANPIYLLGFDMNHGNGSSHWHGGHPIRQMETTIKGFIKYFNIAAAAIRKQGFKVINLNPNSALTCFEKKPPEEILQ